jgi:hypothetical protein
MPRREIGVIGHMRQEMKPVGAEHRRLDDVADGVAQTAPLGLRADEMHGEIEPVGKMQRRLSESLPAAHMPACQRSQRQIDEHAHAQPAAAGRHRRGRFGEGDGSRVHP